MIPEGVNVTYLAFLLHPKLQIHNMYNWGGQNKRYHSYRRSTTVGIKG
jgi:hypothetical protein